MSGHVGHSFESLSKPKKDLTFQKCLDMKLQDYTEQINKISDVAAKEYSIEQALDKMEEQWAPIEFEVMEYKDTGTYIIKARVALG